MLQITNVESPLSIDDVPVETIHRPASVGDVGDLVRQAEARGQAIFPLGGRTQLHVGLPPARPGIGIDLRQLDQVIDYPARDMTITVQAGITIARLREILASENQRLPIDVPQPEQATLGGILATNTSGTRRYGHGTLRDYLIGISVVNDEGQEVKAGGRVVKNVAGYDLCKLYIGSLGTLGIITQATLKLKPRPEASALVTIRCERHGLALLLDQLHSTNTRPVSIDVANWPEQAAGDCKRHLTIKVGFEGNRAAVDWQVEQLMQSIASHDILSIVKDAETEPLWRIATDFENHPQTLLTFRATMLAGVIASFVQECQALPDEILLHALAGNGVVLGHVPPPLSLERARVLLDILGNRVGEGQGNLIVLRCLPEWKKSLPIWGRRGDDIWLMREIKEKLDPRNIFNPGRFVDGI